MHRYNLHRPTNAVCLCCKIEKTFTFKSTSDLVICPGCQRHLGDTLSKSKLRDSDHLEMWAAELNLTNANHSDEVAQFRKQVESLRKQVAEKDKLLEDVRWSYKNERGQEAESVRRWLDAQEVTEAHDQRDAAYRSRDRAMAHLLALDELHHAVDGELTKCSCGKRTSVCKEWDALATITSSLYSWERKQKERRDAGLPHGLPDERFPSRFRSAG